MKVMKVTKEYFETEDEKIYFFEPLEVKIPKWIMQRIADDCMLMVKMCSNWKDEETMIIRGGSFNENF